MAGDAATLRAQPPHWPLVFMLTFISAATGLGCAAALLHPRLTESASNYVTFSSWLFGAVGLGASVFHLGQPLRAWRIFLGWRRSWLSREAIVFGAWFGLATAALFERALLIPGAVVGLAGLGCSAMVYIDTHRHFWRASQTVPRFFGTAALLGGALFAPLPAAALLTVKLAWEWRTVYDRGVSANLQRGPLSPAAFARDGFGVLALVLLVVAPSWAALLPLFAGELAERYLFFRAVDAPRMPGVAA
ncbi:MAG: dimethyl sulfoxide reductase anchor subunit family protein [Opitutaceae bacterium]